MGGGTAEEGAGSKGGGFRGRSLPHASMYHCALLFVDISGFTKLSTLLDPESLSKVSSEIEK
jgi:class 3 adenylate cyclase